MKIDEYGNKVNDFIEKHHNERTIFMVVSGKLEVCKRKGLSHLEWFNDEYRKILEPETFKYIIRGYADTTGIYFYKGLDFTTDETVEKWVIDNKSYIEKVLNAHNVNMKGIPVYCGLIKGMPGSKYPPDKYMYRLREGNTEKNDFYVLYEKNFETSFGLTTVQLLSSSIDTFFYIINKNTMQAIYISANSSILQYNPEILSELYNEITSNLRMLFSITDFSSWTYEVFLEDILLRLLLKMPIVMKAMENENVYLTQDKVELDAENMLMSMSKR